MKSYTLKDIIALLAIDPEFDHEGFEEEIKLLEDYNPLMLATLQKLEKEGSLGEVYCVYWEDGYWHCAGHGIENLTVKEENGYRIVEWSWDEGEGIIRFLKGEFNKDFHKVRDTFASGDCRYGLYIKK